MTTSVVGERAVAVCLYRGGGCGPSTYSIARHVRVVIEKIYMSLTRRPSVSSPANITNEDVVGSRVNEWPFRVGGAGPYVSNGGCHSMMAEVVASDSKSTKQERGGGRKQQRAQTVEKGEIQ